MSKVRCPKCGNRNVAEYLWGMPAFTKKLEEELEVGHVVLGGCMIVCNENATIDTVKYLAEIIEHTDKF